jgi:hypothetical protein
LLQHLGSPRKSKIIQTAVTTVPSTREIYETENYLDLLIASSGIKP